MGRYKVTAVYKPTGEQLRVCDLWSGKTYDYQLSVTLDFIGTESDTGRTRWVLRLPTAGKAIGHIGGNPQLAVTAM